MSVGQIIHGLSEFSEHDTYLFKEGSHFRVYEKMGSHINIKDGIWGTDFAVWAPNAKQVSVIGDFNDWEPGAHSLSMRWDQSGIWEGFIPGLGKGEMYKYHIISHVDNYVVEKADPYGYSCEIAPKSATVIWDLDYNWNDEDWMKIRGRKNALDAPISIYEVHLGSWRKKENGWEAFSYREIAHQLAEYCQYMGFTHVELLPIMEHPFYGSWGYQVSGYFAPTRRYGTPQDFMYLVDILHQHGIGVILDWVPSHFTTDAFALTNFDGTCLYEHEDRRKGHHPDWGSAVFNYGRNEVKNFLISNALYWLDKYHVDGLRVDAVASMLYLDYSRKEGEWIPNKYGGRENLEAIDFLKKFNEVVYQEYPDVQTIAEESTSWPLVTRPLYTGGLGFGFKWNMGWMNDTLAYMKNDPIHRKWNHNKMTFSLMYAFSENFALPFSHDEVVHLKGSMLRKMPGDSWQKFANLRLLYSYQWMHPGKKLLFMGGEFGQWTEWNADASLDWHIIDWQMNRGLLQTVRKLNELLIDEPALSAYDNSQKGFHWIDCGNAEQSILAFVRLGDNEDDTLAIIANFTPVPRENYMVGVPFEGHWKEIFNSDGEEYGGSGCGNPYGAETTDMPWNEMDNSIMVTLPPLALIVLKKRSEKAS